MADSLAGVVLAAGGGTRLRPLTRLRPKALCPVGDTPLVDLALARLERATPSMAVNVHHGRALVEAHLAGRVHLSVEEREALGTAGGLGRLRDWVAGRPVLVANADSWLPASFDTGAFVDGWDGARMRLLTVVDERRGDWGVRRYAGLALLPWSEVARLRPEPSGLWEVSWRHRRPGADLELVEFAGPFVACDTPAEYLAANLGVSAGASVVGEGATVGGTLVRSVVWPESHVWPHEELVDAIRAGPLTVLVR